MTTDYILDKELEKVLDLLTPMNRVIMKTVIHTGLRIGDVLDFRRAELGRQFWIVEQKTKKKRRVNLTAELLEEILIFGQTGSVWAFPSHKDPAKHRTRQAVWADVKRAQKAFRLSENLGTHSGRKAFAVKMYHKYYDIGKVQRALNHASPEVTALYAMADVLTDRRLAQRQKRRGASRSSVS